MFTRFQAMFRDLMTSIERRAFGQNHFLSEARATRALLKFCEDHGYPDGDGVLQHLRACLAALSAGEKSNAGAAFKRIRMGKDGFGDWWPPAVFPMETEEYSWAVFEALVERWHRLMSLMSS
jgi:hypothetical protein